MSESESGHAPGQSGQGPLDGIVVLDLSRMLPGAVLARLLLQLGARVIRVESPAGGDPMRGLPPFQRQGEGKGKGTAGRGAAGEEIGAAFAAFLAGAESVALDLAHPPAAAAVRRLARRCDVLVESFRPGTLARWGLDPAGLVSETPRLIVCSLSSFGSAPPWRDLVGHDLNFAAASGLVSLLSPPGEPRVPGAPVVDLTGGMLAACSILAALVERGRTGRGRVIEQPLAMAALPFLTWPWAELEAAGDDGAADAAGAPATSFPLLTGAVPAYRLYRCAGDEWVALGAMEAKLWLGFLDVVGLPELAPLGLDTGEGGQAAARRLQARLQERSRAEWLALAAERRLPLTAVQDVAAASRDPYYAALGGAAADWLGAAAPPVGGLVASGAAAPPDRRAADPVVRTAPAPRLGQHTDAVLHELGLTPDEIATARQS